MFRRVILALTGLILCWPASALADGVVVRMASGANAGDVQGTVDQFRADLGGVNNGAAPPPASAGRREINWDAVKVDGTDFNGNTTVIDLNHTIGIPVNRFQARGALFEEVYAVSADGFASVNPATAGQFNAFSPTRTFAMFNDNTIGMSFVFASDPSTAPVQAATRGFGAIFLDVETPLTSSIEYFSGSHSLGKYFVPVGPSGGVEFLGVSFDSPIITSVELTVGTDTLFSFNRSTLTPGGAENLAHGRDLAVVDDFIYGEPVHPVPEPATMLLLGTGLAGIAARLRKRRRASLVAHSRAEND